MPGSWAKVWNREWKIRAARSKVEGGEMWRSWRKDYIWPVTNFGYAGVAGLVLEAVCLWSRYREHLLRRSPKKGGHIIHDISLWTQSSLVSWVQEIGNSMWLLVDASLY